MKFGLLIILITLSAQAFAGRTYVERIFAPTNQMYFYSDSMDFSIQFSQDVVVSGQPSIILILDSGRVEAEYISGSGSDTITFRYQVNAGDYDFDGIRVSNRINTNWGSIQSISGSVANTSLSRALRAVNLENILVKGY